MSKNGKIRQVEKAKSEFSESKLAELLKGFSGQEYKKFGLFIKSPYFNKSKILVKLYEYFKPRIKNLDSPKITKESISQYIYPGEKYDDTNVRKLISNFTKMVEEFLVTIESGKEETANKNLLLKSLVARSATRSAAQLITELTKGYSEQLIKNEDFYLNMLKTQKIAFSYAGSRLKSPDEQIKDLSKSVDLYYLSLKILHYYDILNLRLHYSKNIDFDMWAFDEIVRFIEKNKEEIKTSHSAIYADYLSVMMLLNYSDSYHYYNLRDYVTEHKDMLGASGIDRFYIYLYNHSIYRLNKGIVDNSIELYEIIKLIDKENIPIWIYFAFHIFYINAVTNAARNNEFEWAESFIVRRKDKIQPEIRSETHSLAMANLYFTRKDYDNALRYLVNVDYPNYSYYLMAKDMLIKIYWERTETEGVISTIDAMRKFLQRKENIPQRLHESYSNFINCVSKMIDTNSKDRTYEIKKLMEKEMIAADKNWVRDKLRTEEF